MMACWHSRSERMSGKTAARKDIAADGAFEHAAFDVPVTQQLAGVAESQRPKGNSGRQ
jgi:hypothetical protein